MARVKADSHESPTVIADVVCNRCGCGCDDLKITLQRESILVSENGCRWAQDWFQSPVDESLPICRNENQAVDFAAGVNEAVRLLKASQYPLVWGLHDTTCEAQTKAAAIADWLGGAIDVPGAGGPWGVPFTNVGEITTTLGEIADRADLLLFWNCDPDTIMPRFRARCIERPGRFVPQGRAGRYLVAIHDGQSSSPADVDETIAFSSGTAFEVLWELRACVQGKSTSSMPISLTELAKRLADAKYPVIVFAAASPDAPAIQALVKDLARVTRCVSLGLHGPGNILGAEQVLLWRTGYSHAVDFSAGFPRSLGEAFSADTLLANGKCDLVLQIGNGFAANPHSTNIPRIELLPAQAKNSATDAAVTFFISIPGISAAGTTYRTDGVPLPQRALRSTTRPSDAEVLAAIELQLRPK
jgi:formylmethanofuran dehydrogenase subunit B